MSGAKGTSRRFALWVALAAMIVVIGAGCAAKVNRDVLSSIKKVGILSVTIDKLGTQASDDEVMQSTVDYAAKQFSDALAKRPEWKLVPLSYREPVIRDFLKKPAPQKQEGGDKEAKGFAAALKKLSAAVQEATSLESFAEREKKNFLGAAGMPIVSYRLVVKTGPTTTRKGKAQVKEDWSSLRKEMYPRVGELASTLNLDGLIVIYLRTAIHSTVGVEVIHGERANDTVRMAPTMALVSRDGKVAIDMGEPHIDAVTMGNAGMPIYKVAGHRGGTIILGKNKSNFVIDLKDPKGKVQKDMYALTNLALSHFMKQLDKQLAPKK